jgi:hypothetical protein
VVKSLQTQTSDVISAAMAGLRSKEARAATGLLDGCFTVDIKLGALRRVLARGDPFHFEALVGRCRGSVRDRGLSV